LFKSRVFAQKIEIFLKMEIWKSKYWPEILAKNTNLLQKWKFLLKIKLLAKNKKNPIMAQKINFFC